MSAGMKSLIEEYSIALIILIVTIIGSLLYDRSIDPFVNIFVLWVHFMD